MMLLFLKNNTMVPKKATKTTKTTFVEKKRFSHFYEFLQNLRNIKEYPLRQGFFSGKSSHITFCEFLMIEPNFASKSIFWAQKIDFGVFLDPKIPKNRFFQKCSQRYILWKNTLEHPKSPFPTIFDHIKSYKRLCEKSNFCQNRDFHGFWENFEFSMFHLKIS